IRFQRKTKISKVKRVLSFILTLLTVAVIWTFSIKNNMTNYLTYIKTYATQNILSVKSVSYTLLLVTPFIILATTFYL
ncbi:hypothetical protein OAT16_11825, partial [Prolixibacteraceae bacterium]|nr:hypothetical protein [Prolixibacteraceae bacterium]